MLNPFSQFFFDHRRYRLSKHVTEFLYLAFSFTFLLTGSLIAGWSLLMHFPESKYKILYLALSTKTTFMNTIPIRKYYLKIFICLFAFSAFSVKNIKAQWAYVPDVNFSSAIAALVPSAIAGDSLDTTNVQIINMQSLSVDSLGITDLTGLEYFVNLKYLDCTGNDLFSLPSLPTSLDTLICDYNSLSALPTLPSSLRLLSCSNNLLISLPALPDTITALYCGNNNMNALPALPSALIDLNCSNNQLLSFPAIPSLLVQLKCSGNALPLLSALDSSLTYLDCSGNVLDSLPPLPPSLVELYCDFNHLHALPSLPTSLTWFYCNHNQITSLPALPAGLSYLKCSFNQLDSLPVLPPLTWLFCSNNSLHSLPSLPVTITYLVCDGNQLTSLPALPPSIVSLSCNNNQLFSLPALPASLNYLYCSSNQLTSLPALPANLLNLQCGSNQISCLPTLPDFLGVLNGVNGGYTCLPNEPLFLNTITGPSGQCTPSNSACFGYPLITGTAYNDDNSDNQKDSSETGHPNLIIQIQPGNYFFPTDDTGYFACAVDTGITYTISAQPVSYYTILPNAQSALPFHVFGTSDTSNDFALQRTGNIRDLTTVLTAFTPAESGFDCRQNVTIRNNGTQTDTASLLFLFDPQYTFVDASSLPDSVNAYSVRWNNIRLTPGEKSSYHITLHISGSVPVSTNLYSYAILYPIAGDSIPADNTDTLLQVVGGAYSPNQKTVFPAGDFSVSEVASGQWLDYIVRFQNTGTVFATKVEVKDSLSSNLNLSTFQFVSSSNPVTWNIRHGIADFIFDNINLPDSGSDETGSHGFVRYRVMPYTNLTDGSVIYNTASVYFDHAGPVVTNTVTTHVYDPLGINHAHADESGLLVYPNPAKDKINIEPNASSRFFELSDMTGKILMTDFITSSKTEVDLRNFANGIYILTVYMQDKLIHMKVVKE